jgi:hypothetical protein
MPGGKYRSMEVRMVERTYRGQHTSWGQLLLPAFSRTSSACPSCYRSDTPRIAEIRYRLTVHTDEPDARVELLHRNISTHGTIFNTLASVCEVSGVITAQRSHGA